MRKLRVAVLYGGRSGEHEVSLQSAASVITHLDRNRFEIVPVAIDKQGRWHLNDISLLEGKKSLPVFKDAPKVVLPPNPPDTSSGSALIGLAGSGQPRTIDVVFPVMHGPLCEDGTMQGLLEIAGVPYVGCGVLASALAMDKVVAKEVLARHGIPQVAYVAARHGVGTPAAVDLGWPRFVKPANMGSSVGISKVRGERELAAAIELASMYDEWVVIEEGVTGREVECAVLGGLHPEATRLGEIIPGAEFYDYDDKY